MGFFDRIGKPSKPAPRRDPAERWKDAGAREYEARHAERQAERLEAIGDVEGAQAERERAAELRRPQSTRR